MRTKKFRLRQQPPEGYWTTAKTAEYLGVSVKTVRRYIKNHGLPAVKVSHIYLVDIENLRQWIKEHE